MKDYNHNCECKYDRRIIRILYFFLGLVFYHICLILLSIYVSQTFKL